MLLYDQEIDFSSASSLSLITESKGRVSNHYERGIPIKT